MTTPTHPVIPDNSNEASTVRAPELGAASGSASDFEECLAGYMAALHVAGGTKLTPDQFEWCRMRLTGDARGKRAPADIWCCLYQQNTDISHAP